jgi:hypothetical protein
LKDPYCRIKFNVTFAKTITGDAKTKERKDIDLSKYDGYEITYHGYDFKLVDHKVQDRSLTLHFNHGEDGSFQQKAISVYIFYSYNSQGMLDGKPSVSVSYYAGFPSKYEDINTPVLDPLLKDVLKQIKG